MGGSIIEFGRYRLDVTQRALLRGDEPVRLGSRAMDILIALASARGEVVGKDKLLSLVWPGLTVGDNNLQVQISALRKALDDEQGEASPLVTVPSRGYRLVGIFESSENPALPDKPSIAVLPFQNLSDDPKQDYLADGIVADLVTALCRIPWLFVIAHNSTLAFKEKPVDVKDVARELGVRYVLNGGVRKAGERVRITTQLVDGSTGAHLWADQFDGGLDAIFDLQDKVSTSIAGAISPKLEQAEIERMYHKPTGSLGAYEYYLRGLASVYRVTREATDEALRLFERAIELDPDFAAPQGGAAFCFVSRKLNGWMSDPVGRDIAEAERFARRAAELGQDDAAALALAGLALGYVVGDLDGGVALADRALALNPNLATAWYASGTVRIFRGGEPDIAIEHLARAMRLSPLDPFLYTMQGMTAYAYCITGRYDEACAWAEKAFWQKPDILATLRISAASNAYAGRMEESRRSAVRLLELDPGMRLSNLRDRIGASRFPEDYAKYAEGLRMAGLPE
ncbi:MAG TPA: winged helix-turn-helix domain-containing tetratricopeptide repeat protein [Pseudolabrys sp.]|nr:winged helix-turn-helix domain-containing tetratricopeptide repeat protein [Pseudolabrys sp.]